MEINERGNTIERGFELYSDRYKYDFRICTAEKGWKQYDTAQDASYFGIWVNVQERKIFTYAEGDTTLITCPTIESLRAELESMAKFYGDPPPAWIVYDTAGNRTDIYDTRPTA